MDSETLEHCLEPFFTTKQAGRGTGLGLAAVHGIVVQSGGELRIDSRPGVGTAVIVSLPAIAEELDTVESIRLPAPSDPVVFGAATILIVDDDYEVRSMVRGILRERGYSTLVAHSGTAALDLLADYSGPLDLVLTDVAMAGMSGLDLARELRDKHPGLAGTPVLFMSGFADQEGIGQYGDFAEADYVAKPFTPDGLARQVEEAIAKVNWSGQASNR
jgi:CheY-like chemotaxis protein